MSSSLSDRRVNEHYHVPHLTYTSSGSSPVFPQQQQSQTRAGPSSETVSSSNETPGRRPSRLRGLRPWSFSARTVPSNASPSKPGPSGKPKADDPVDADLARALQSYEQLRVADPRDKPLPLPVQDEQPSKWLEADDEWVDNEPDAYSWVDPSEVGTERARATVSTHVDLRPISLNNPAYKQADVLGRRPESVIGVANHYRGVSSTCSRVFENGRSHIHIKDMT